VGYFREVSNKRHVSGVTEWPSFEKPVLVMLATDLSAVMVASDCTPIDAEANYLRPLTSSGESPIKVSAWTFQGMHTFSFI
jgi:hypothetical protein